MTSRNVSSYRVISYLFSSGSQLSLASFENNEKLLLTPRNVSDVSHTDVTSRSGQGDAILQQTKDAIVAAVAVGGSQESGSQPDEFRFLPLDLSQPEGPVDAGEIWTPKIVLRDRSGSDASDKDDVIDDGQKVSSSNDDYVYSSDFCSEPIATNDDDVSNADDEVQSPMERAYIAQMGASGTQDTHASSEMMPIALDKERKERTARFVLNAFLSAK